MKKLLIINSQLGGNKPLAGIFEALSGAYDLEFWAADDFWSGKSFKEVKKLFFPKSLILIFLFWPCLAPVYFFLLLFFRFNPLSARRVIMIGPAAKILFSWPAKMLGLKIFWLELPGERISRLAKKFQDIFSKSPFRIVFTSAGRLALAEKIPAGKIFSLCPGFPAETKIRQGDIFSEMADSAKPAWFLKSFTIGAVVDFSDFSQFEIFLKALKKCSSSIPGIQAVVIGSVSRRRDLNWLLKKMGLERRVWFVGEQEDLAKWLESFDLYMFIASHPNLFDLETVLLAMFCGAPVIAFRHEDLEDFLFDKETGFLENEQNADRLADRFIEIWRDKPSLDKAAKAGERLVAGLSGREKQKEELIKILGDG
jgi:glycosyltransferase involved in cell wall biosynthesis